LIFNLLLIFNILLVV